MADLSTTGHLAVTQCNARMAEPELANNFYNFFAHNPCPIPRRISLARHNMVRIIEGVSNWQQLAATGTRPLAHLTPLPALLMSQIPSNISALMVAKYINLPQVKDTNNKRCVETRMEKLTKSKCRVDITPTVKCDSVRAIVIITQTDRKPLKCLKIVFCDQFCPKSWDYSRWACNNSAPEGNW